MRNPPAFASANAATVSAWWWQLKHWRFSVYRFAPACRRSSPRRIARPVASGGAAARAGADTRHRSSASKSLMGSLQEAFADLGRRHPAAVEFPEPTIPVSREDFIAKI